MRTCSVEGCTQKHTARGYCGWHYRRLPDSIERQRRRDERAKEKPDFRERRRAAYRKCMLDPERRERKRQTEYRRWRENLEENRRRGREVAKRCSTPEKTRIRSANRRARERGVRGSHSLSDWLVVVAIYNGVCPACKKDMPVPTADHITPLTWEETTHNIENIQALCGSCNSSKNDRFDTFYAPIDFPFLTRPMYELLLQLVTGLVEVPYRFFEFYEVLAESD